MVDDLYLSTFGRERDQPGLSYRQALRLAREVVSNPSTELRPAIPDRGPARRCVSTSPKAVAAEMEIRKRRRGILGYDDLLSRLASALAPMPGPAADEGGAGPLSWSTSFQDTDPVQWRVIDYAFNGEVDAGAHRRLKQAIYAFRGGDIVTYLRLPTAREEADPGQELAHRRRTGHPGCRRCWASGTG